MPLNPYSDRSDSWLQSLTGNAFWWIRRFRLIVIVALFLLPTVVLFILAIVHFSANDLTRVDMAKLQITTIRQASQAYYLKTGELPVHLRDLLDCPQYMSESQWRGPYLEGDNLPLDPWQQPYSLRVYSKGDREFLQIICRGPDQQFGTQDDILNQFGVRLETRFIGQR